MIPKSERYALPSPSSSTLSGLMAPWTTPARCACLQRVAELIDHRDRLCGGERAALEDRRRGSVAHQTRHEVGGVGLAPVVVERDDVRMLERCDDLRLGLEPTNETRVVGDVGTNDLDRHLTTDGGLIGPKDAPALVGSELLAQLVSTNRRAKTGAVPPGREPRLRSRAARRR